MATSHKNFKRVESRNKHSWWWDSHISPKNSKWLAENVEEMDQSVKRMLKLIEEEGDSFAKKAEIYYQKRPELIAHVEGFYRMYRSLAERYDNVTGELRRNIPSDLRSQSSGISDVASEPPSRMPSPDHRLGRRQSGSRPAGFDVFLKNGGSSLDLGTREGDETSTLDSESDSDDSSVNNYSGASTHGDYQELRKRITELEGELRRVQMQQENLGGSYKGLVKHDSSDGLSLSRIADYEEELQAAKEKIKLSEEEIRKLRIRLIKYESMESRPPNVSDDSHGNITNEEFPEQSHMLLALEEELKVTREKLLGSEEEVKRLRCELESNGSHLQEKLESAQKDASAWKSKLDREKREVSKLQDRISRYKANLSERDQEIRALRETVSNANKSLSEENAQLQDQMTKLLKERAFLEDNIKEWDLRCQCLEEDLRRIEIKKIEFEADIEQLKAEIAEKDQYIKTLKLERDELNGELSLKDDQIDQLNQHLHQLHLEHMELVSGIEKSSKSIAELKSRSKELEREVERKQEVIKEGAEEKREAIRQLCFSLEHYRNAYQMLRQDLVGHNSSRHSVVTSEGSSNSESEIVTWNYSHSESKYQVISYVQEDSSEPSKINNPDTRTSHITSDQTHFPCKQSSDDTNF